MRHYHCPYCNALIQHRPQYAGERVTCSQCKGAYYEPTDPLPGVKPEKSPPVGNPERVEGPIVLERKVKPAGRRVSATRGIDECEAGDMVAELARRGQNAILLFWSPDNPSDAGLAYSKNLSRQQADDQLIQVAAHVMRQRWPDLHQLITHRLATS